MIVDRSATCFPFNAYRYVVVCIKSTKDGDERPGRSIMTTCISNVMGTGKRAVNVHTVDFNLHIGIGAGSRSGEGIVVKKKVVTRRIDENLVGVRRSGVSILGGVD